MTRAIGAVACLSLLTLQLSGAHLHIGVDGALSGVPEVSYSHSHGHHHHDDGDHSPSAASHHDTKSAQSGDDLGKIQDVSLLDQALTTLKIPMAVLAVMVLFFRLPRARTLAGTDVSYPVLSGRYTRWRPPLRAPPQPA